MTRYIKLHDGTLIDTATGQAVVSTEINKAFSDDPKSSLVSGAGIDGVNRRYLDDLPCTPPQSRAVAVILAYTLFGLHELDIARILNTNTENIRSVQASEPYAKFLEALLQNIREHDRDAIRKKLNKAALGAADRIVGLSDSADEKVALTASKDILDRVAKSERDTASSLSGGLTIRIIDDRESTTGLEVEIDG